jgi:hypothetical protein
LPAATTVGSLDAAMSSSAGISTRAISILPPRVSNSRIHRLFFMRRS